MGEFLIISAVYLTGGFVFFRYWAKYQITKHDTPRDQAIRDGAAVSVFWPLFVGGYFLAMIVGTVYGWAVAGLPESRSEREHKIRLLEDEVLRDGRSREDEVKARLLRDAMTQKVIADMPRGTYTKRLRCDRCRCPIAPVGNGAYTHLPELGQPTPCDLAVRYPHAAPYRAEERRRARDRARRHGHSLSEADMCSRCDGYPTFFL